MRYDLAMMVDWILAGVGVVDTLLRRLLQCSYRGVEGFAAPLPTTAANRRLVSFALLLVWFVTVGWVAAPAEAVHAELVGAVPRDNLAVVFIEPRDVESSGEPKASVPNSDEEASRYSMWPLLRGMTQSGVFGEYNESISTVVDTFSSASVLQRYPLAVVVSDAKARRLDDGGYRLAELQLALVVLTRGENKAIADQIRALLNSRTDSGVAMIQRQEEFGTTTFTLTDSRLPDWAQFKWAAIGDFYVVSLGRESFNNVAGTIGGEAASMGSSPEFVRRHKSVGGAKSWLEWRADFAGIRRSLGPVMAGKPNQVLEKLHLGNVDEGLWAVGVRGRAVTATSLLVRGDSETVVPISSAVESEAELGRLVPPQATSYAVINHSARWCVERGSQAYLAAKNESTQQNYRRLFDEFESKAGISIEEDLLDQLGNRIVIHDYPRHPLNLPLVCTIQIEIAGSRSRVQRAVDVLLAQCSDWFFDGDPEKSGRGLGPAFRRSEEGIWCLQAGIYGPALAVGEKWIVISFSPQAVEQVLAWQASVTQKDSGEGSAPEKALTK